MPNKSRSRMPKSSRGFHTHRHSPPVEAGPRSDSEPIASEATPLLLGPKGFAQVNHGTLSPASTSSCALSNSDGPNTAETEVDYSRILPIIFSTWVGVFLAALDGTIIVTLTGSISGSFQSFQIIAWLASAYFIANAAFQPLSGKLTDIFGRGNGLIFGNVAFLLGNLLCGIAPSASWLIFGRIVAGVGGGAMTAIATFIMSDLVPLRTRALWQGMCNITYAVGGTTGAFAGGFINDTWGWRWAFLIQVPLVFISGIIVCIYLGDASETTVVRTGTYVDDADVPSSSASSTTNSTASLEDDESAILVRFCSPCNSNTLTQQLSRVDFLGAATLVASIVLLLTALNLGGNFVPWSHPYVGSSMALGFILLGLFIYVEASVAKEPIIPVRLCAIPTVFGSLMATFFSTIAIMSILFYVPLYYQARGYSASVSGMFTIPQSLGAATGSFIAGIVIRKTGSYIGLNHLTMVTQMAGYAVLVVLMRPGIHVAINMAIMTVLGAMYCSCLTIDLVSIISVVDVIHQAAITSASYACRSTGSTIGIAIATGVFQNLFKSRLQTRFGDMPDASEIIERIRKSGLDEIDRIPPDWREGTLQEYISSLQGVWLTGLTFAVLGWAFALMIRQPSLLKGSKG